MSLAERLKDRYGWMCGNYPQSIVDIVEQEPTLAEPLEQMRKSTVQALAIDATMPLCVATMYIPTYGTAAWIASYLTRSYFLRKKTTESELAEMRFENKASHNSFLSDGRKEDIIYLEKSYALNDLTERMKQAKFDTMAAVLGLFGTGLAVSAIHSAYEGKTTQTLINAGLGVALAVGSFFAFRHLYGKNERIAAKKRRDIEERIEREYASHSERAKNITEYAKTVATQNRSTALVKA